MNFIDEWMMNIEMQKGGADVKWFCKLKRTLMMKMRNSHYLLTL